MEFEPTASWLRGMHSTAVLQPQVHDFRKSWVKKIHCNQLNQFLFKIWLIGWLPCCSVLIVEEWIWLEKKKEREKESKTFFSIRWSQFQHLGGQIKKNFEGCSKNYSEGNRWGKKWLTNWLWSSSWLPVGGFDSSWHLDKRPSRSWKIRRKTGVYGRALSSGECGDYTKW